MWSHSEDSHLTETRRQDFKTYLKVNEPFNPLCQALTQALHSTVLMAAVGHTIEMFPHWT